MTRAFAAAHGAAGYHKLTIATSGSLSEEVVYSEAMHRFLLPLLLVAVGCAPADSSRPITGAPDTGQDAGRDTSSDSEEWDAVIGDALFVDAFDTGAVDADMPDSGADALADVRPDVPSGPQDELDLSSVVWFDDNISGWPITDELTVSFPNGRDIEFRHSQRTGWMPHRNLGEDSSGNDVIVNANTWVFAEVDGVWYGGTFEYLRPGQTIKRQDAVDGAHVKAAPLNDDGTTNWRPQSGDEVYFMVSGLVRRFLPVERNVMERTNVVRVTWP